MTARPQSLQRRLGLGLALGVTLLWLAGSLVAGLILRHEIDEVFDSALQELTQRLLPLAYSEILNSDPPAGGESLAQRLPPVLPHQEVLTYIVRDAEGRVLLQSHDADPAAFPGPPRAGFAEAAGLRLYTEAAVQGSFFVTSAEPIAHRRRAIMGAVGMLLWPLLALLPLSQLGVWLLVRYALRPLGGFQAEIEARGRGDLSQVGDAALPQELRPMAAAVNRLIARLRRALEAERGFTASSAHELRTPIAAALAQTQRLIAELPAGSQQERAARIEAALRHLSRLSEKLLQLAKAEGGGLLAETPHDPSEILGFVLDEFRGTGRLMVTRPPQGARPSRMDADAFAILSRNLIENALKHGAAEGAVEVELTEGGLFRVANAGPLIPAEELRHLTRAFQRGATRASGSGLGLAIAQAIAQGAGTRLELLSPIPGRPDGFEARVQLPVAGG